MTRALNLTPGDEILRKDNSRSGLFYEAEAEKPKASFPRRIKAKCGCGATFTVPLGNVRSGRTRGCANCTSKRIGESNQVDKVGCRFGRLLVIKRAPGRCGRRLLYLCRCDCGAEKVVSSSNLVAHGTQSCGCLLVEAVERNNEKRKWQEGDKIGVYTILAREDEKTRQGQTIYTVFDERDNREKTLRQNRIWQTRDEVGYLRHLISSRIRTAMRSKKIRKTRSLVKGFTWSIEDILEHIGPRPAVGDWHLDHICPLAIARGEEEVIALNHPTNLRWVIGADNIRKSDKWTEEGAQLCFKLLGRPWKPEV